MSKQECGAWFRRNKDPEWYQYRVGGASFVLAPEARFRLHSGNFGAFVEQMTEVVNTIEAGGADNLDVFAEDGTNSEWIVDLGGLLGLDVVVKKPHRLMVFSEFVAMRCLYEAQDLLTPEQQEVFSVNPVYGYYYPGWGWDNYLFMAHVDGRPVYDGTNSRWVDVEETLEGEVIRYSKRVGPVVPEAIREAFGIKLEEDDKGDSWSEWNKVLKEIGLRWADDLKGRNLLKVNGREHFKLVDQGYYLKVELG